MNTIKVSMEEKLLLKMKKIFKDFESMGLFPYEIYTLMCSYAIKIKCEYNMDIHSRLMNKL